MNILAISDTHIGDPHVDKNLPKLFEFLNNNVENIDILVLVGDIFDLAYTFAFDKRHNEFLEIVRKYKKVVYVEGNHDWVIEEWNEMLSDIECCEEYVIDDKIFLHGHQFDFFASKLPIIQRALIHLNKYFYQLFKIDVQNFFRKFDFVKKFFTKSGKKRIVDKYKNDYKYIICGHSHLPCVEKHGDLFFANCGDWVTSCSFVFLIDEQVFGGKYEEICGS